jgi:DNA-directed RNA polymerase I subunit RPA49
MTSAAETLLLTHMFALCLRVDDYATDPKILADDLKMPVAKFVSLDISNARQPQLN